jgi:HD-like signal output (HDOD) protein
MNKKINPVMTHEQSVDALVKTIRIPPRPSLLADVQRELAEDEPNPRRLAKIIANDVALSASLLKLTNSSFFGLRLKATSVDHAVDLLGMEQSGLLMMGILARKAVGVKGLSLLKFWDFSSRRAQAMTYLSRKISVCSSDAAHTFGLFCDIGVPILLERFPDYGSTLQLANAEFVAAFTSIEDQQHTTNHASIGALMARTWGLPEEISTAILLHHDYAVLDDAATDDAVKGLVSLALLSEYGIQKYQGQEISAEWEKGGDYCCRFLGISLDEAEDCFDELHELFNEVH